MDKLYFRFIGGLAILAGGLLALHLWWQQQFTLPLGLMVLVLMLGALWLQGESK